MLVEIEDNFEEEGEKRRREDGKVIIWWWWESVAGRCHIFAIHTCLVIFRFGRNFSRSVCVCVLDVRARVILPPPTLSLCERAHLSTRQVFARLCSRPLCSPATGGSVTTHHHHHHHFEYSNTEEEMFRESFLPHCRRQTHFWNQIFLSKFASENLKQFSKLIRRSLRLFVAQVVV